MCEIVKTERKGNNVFVVRQSYNTDKPEHEFVKLVTVSRSQFSSIGDETKEAKDIMDVIARDGSVKNRFKRSSDTIYFPLYGYNHSGYALSTTPFGCRFDSGLIGYVSVDKIKVRKIVNCLRIDKKVKAQIDIAINNLLTMMEYYINGDIYDVIVENTEGEEIDSIECYGLTEVDRFIKEY